MREMHRFCTRCGHELRPDASFCVNCGGSVPDSADQLVATGGPDPHPAPWQAPDRPAHPPAITGSPVPPDLAPPGGVRPPRPATPARPPRRPVVPWLLGAALAVFVLAGGTVAGLVLIRHLHGQPSAQRQTAAVSSPTSSPTITTSSPAPAPPPTQVNIQGVPITIGAVNTDPDATAVAATLAAYFGGIDTQNYRQAWDVYTAALQAAVPFQPFATNLSTSQDGQVVVQSIQHDANGDIEAEVSFQSHQAGQYGPNPGETCTNWSLDYDMVPSSSASLAYLIDKVTDVGAGHASC